MKSILFTLTLAGLFLSHPLMGQAQSLERFGFNGAQFEVCDVQRNDNLSQIEYVACWPHRGDTFDRLDRNGDGGLTHHELGIGRPQLHRDQSEGAR